MELRSLVLLSAVAAAVSVLPAAELVPFVIPAAPGEGSLAALAPLPPIAPDGPRLVARDGGFHLGDRRVRVWGVNTCFGANFPTHADAERVAERLARGGINSVRLHHMDTQAFPSGIWDPKDPMKLSAEALDRLDYFIDQLARRGITVNVNLHVSRTHSRPLGLPQEGNMPSFDKVIGLFTPRLVEAQRKYARDLLGHVNRYRKVRYADDPAVAFAEITNEDSFFMWNGEQTLRSLGPYYESILRGMWVAWLKRRYGSTDALRKAWDRGAQPLGEDLIGDAAFTLKPPADAKAPQWSLEVHSGTAASAKPLAGTPNAARVEIAKVDGTDWHLQFKNIHLKLRGGQYYTLRFRARADRPKKISLTAGMAHEPWRMLGLSRGLDLTTRWKTYRVGFVCSADEPDGRISFVIGADAAAVELADVTLATGGQVGLLPAESIEAGNVALFADSEVEARALDRIRFLAETEKAYFDSMRKLIREEIGCKALVTGTIVFGPAGLYAQSDMDFIDAHAYWHHPQFPGRPWDAGNWIVDQSAMTDAADGGTLSGLACRRLAGKPYTVSEYNHPAPMDVQAECVPMIAAFAASQDWDGIWLFAYCHRTDDWDRQAYTSFFDMDANPAKFGFFAAAAVLYRDGGLAPSRMATTVDLSSDDPLTRFAELHLRYGASMRNVLYGESKLNWARALAGRVYASMGAKPPRSAETARPLLWVIQSGRGQFVARGTHGVVETGWWPANDGEPTFRAVMAAALDGKPLAASGKVLIAACGRCENTGMKFTPDRRTVGRNWGGPPVRIEPVDHALTLPGTPGERLRLQPLGPDGKPKGQAMDISLGADGTIKLPAAAGTMWYLLTR